MQRQWIERKPLSTHSDKQRCLFLLAHVPVSDSSEALNSSVVFVVFSLLFLTPFPLPVFLLQVIIDIFSLIDPLFYFLSFCLLCVASNGQLPPVSHNPFSNINVSIVFVTILAFYFLFSLPHKLSRHPSLLCALSSGWRLLCWEMHLWC